MANYNKVNESKFIAVKIMFDGGATAKEVCKYMKISEGTAYLMKTSETFTEYVNRRTEYDLVKKANLEAAKKQEEKKEEPKPEEPTKTEEQKNPTVIKVEANHYMMEEMRKTNELLKGISAKLAFIVEELTGVKS